VLNDLGSGPDVANDVKALLGWALVVAAVSMVVRAFLSARTVARVRDGVIVPPPDDETVVVKRAATVLIGLTGGFIVGMTSVGSGSLMMVMLLLLYPRLSAKRLVGTDLVQAIPLVGAATLSHMLFGHVDFGLTASLLIGCLPGVYFGAKVSSRAPDSVIRPALVVILFASALKLLDVSNSALGAALALVVLIGAPLWGATDASLRAPDEWETSGFRRTTWVTAQSVAAPFLVGFPIAIAYALFVRPQLRRRRTAPVAR